MTINEYQKLAMRTANPNLSQDKQLKEGLMGLNGEAGECIDILKKHLFQGHIMDRDHLIRELGDVCWYLALSATALDCDLEDIFKSNIEKLAHRYPDGFNPEHSINRNTSDL